MSSFHVLVSCTIYFMTEIAEGVTEYYSYLNFSPIIAKYC